MVRSRSTSVKTLTSDEVHEQHVDPLFTVWLVARSTEDLMDGLLATAGLTGDEFALYSILAASPGITPTELSRWMAAPPTSVSSYVKRLEARGHLHRRPNPTDRRSYLIDLTDAGRATHDVAATLFDPVRAQIIADLGDDQVPVQESLLLLRRVVDALRTDNR